MRCLAVTVLFASISWPVLFPAASYGQTQTGVPQPSSPTAGLQTAQAQPIPVKRTPAKVWTNDDIDVLGKNQSVSVVGTGADTKKVSTSSKPVPQEKDPAWYRKQLVPLRAEIEKLDPQVAKLQAFLSGENISDPPTMHHQLVPTPQDQLKQMEAKRQADAAKMDDLMDRARHNGIEPGALR